MLFFCLCPFSAGLSLFRCSFHHVFIKIIIVYPLPLVSRPLPTDALGSEPGGPKFSRSRAELLLLVVAVHYVAAAVVTVAVGEHSVDLEVFISCFVVEWPLQENKAPKWLVRGRGKRRTPMSVELENTQRIPRFHYVCLVFLIPPHVNRYQLPL